MPLHISRDPDLLKIIAGMQTLEPVAPKPTPASLLADAHAARSAGKREEAITLYNRVYHLNKSPEALAALTDMDAIEVYRGHNDSSAPAVSTSKALSLPTPHPAPPAPSEVQSEPPMRRHTTGTLAHSSKTPRRNPYIGFLAHKVSTRFSANKS